MDITRREFMKSSLMTGAVIAVGGTGILWKPGTAYAFYQSPGLQKWVMPLRSAGLKPTGIPVALPDATPAPVTNVKHYTIDIVQFSDTLHTGFPGNVPTTLWGFNPALALDPFTLGAVTPVPTHLGGIIIAQKGEPIQITFRNRLTKTGAPSTNPADQLLNIIPVDTSIPGAAQAQNRTAIHLHGGLVPWISDGGPFDWWAPNDTHGLSFLNNVVLNPSAAINEAEYYYPNNQSARLVWYHDHAFGITRINAYAGIASAYIIRDTFEAGLVSSKGLPPFIESSIVSGQPIREIPIVIQDKIFVGQNIRTQGDPKWPAQCPDTPGSLWYGHTYDPKRWKVRAPGRAIPDPSVIAEFFGDTILVNGTVFPEVKVEPRRYRLRMLNACNARFLNLQLLEDDGSADGVSFDFSTGAPVPTNTPGPDWLVIGTEGGFLQKPVAVTPANFDVNTLQGSLITAPAERWDVIVDFTNKSAKKFILYSDTPAPFPGGDPRNDYFPGAPGNPTQPAAGFGPNTRTLMRFDVSLPLSLPSDPALLIDSTTDLTGGLDPFLVPISNILNGSWPSALPAGTKVRGLTLNEQFDEKGRLIQLLGTNVAKTAGSFGRTYLDPSTENVTDGDIEVWQITNLTGDTHPIHFHLVNVQILARQQFNPARFNGTPNLITGTQRPPDATELGWKETVRMNPNEVIWVIMKFDLNGTQIKALVSTNPPVYSPVDLTSVEGDANGNPPPSPRTGDNEYVWHCHILEHEEHDMMRPLIVKPKPQV